MKDAYMFYRVDNFKSLKTTGIIEIAPITIFIGPNATGKSSALQPLLFLAQTMANSRDEAGFLSNGEYLNLGNYGDFINQHDVTKKLNIELDFNNACKNGLVKYLKDKRSKKIENTKIGDIPPSKYNIKFSYGKDNQPELEQIRILDCMDRLLLSRKLTKNKKYNINFFEEIDMKDKEIYESIKNQKPRNFIFDDYDVVDSVLKRKNGDKRIPEVKFEKSVAAYLNVISWNKRQVINRLKKIKYIGPIREEAKRIYTYNKKNFDYAGCFGENTASMLYQNRELAEENNELKEWLVRFRLAQDFKMLIVPNHPELFSLEFKESKKDYYINYADSCFGLSQLLPVLVQSIYSKNGEINIIEQPELHLNPCLESVLADFFTGMINKYNKKYFIIETHSEYFLLRLRTYIKTGKLSCNKVNIYFTENIDGNSTIRKIDIDKNGEFPNNDWPIGFFEDSLSENMMFATAVNQ
jgi:predicted ATPase